MRRAESKMRRGKTPRAGPTRCYRQCPPCTQLATPHPVRLALLAPPCSPRPDPALLTPRPSRPRRRTRLSSMSHLFPIRILFTPSLAWSWMFLIHTRMSDIVTNTHTHTHTHIHEGSRGCQSDLRTSSRATPRQRSPAAAAATAAPPLLQCSLSSLLSKVLASVMSYTSRMPMAPR